MKPTTALPIALIMLTLGGGVYPMNIDQVRMDLWYWYISRVMVPHSLVLRMAAGMDYTVHVQVEIVELDAIGVGLRCIHGNCYSSHHFRLYEL